MHRLANRRGIFERSSWLPAQDDLRHHKLQTSLRLRSTFCTIRHLLPAAGRNYRIVISVRRLATASDAKTKLEVSGHDPPVPPLAARKSSPKIDLRPGPIKLNSTGKTLSEVNLSDKLVRNEALQGKTQIPVVQERKGKSEALEERKPSNVLQTAKSDIENAMRHGVMKPPPEGAGRIQLLWHQLKELFKFYIGGIKLIYVHQQQAKKIRDRVKAGGAPISRWERRFLNTHRADLMKLVPFVLMLIVIEEIIPLIVLYAPGFLPSTCVLPSQRARIIAQRRTRQRNAYEVKDSNLLDAITRIASSEDNRISLNFLEPNLIRTLCGVLGLSDQKITALNRVQLRRQLRSIAEDDELLASEDNGGKLSEEEVTEVLWERGLPPDDLSSLEQRSKLSDWLNDTNALPATHSSSVDLISTRAHILLKAITVSHR